MKLFLFSERTMLYSHIAIHTDICTIDQCLQYSVCLNFQLRQAFSKCKSIFLVSKIYPACTVYVAFARHVPRLSQMNGAVQHFCKLSLSRFYANHHDEDYDI